MDSIFKELSFRAVITDLRSIKKCYNHKALDTSITALERINYIKDMKIMREPKNADEELYFIYYNAAIDDVLKLFYGDKE